MYRREVSHTRPDAKGAWAKSKLVKLPPVEEVKTLASLGRKTIPGHHGQRATKVERPGHHITVELDAIALFVARRRAANFSRVGVAGTKGCAACIAAQAR